MPRETGGQWNEANERLLLLTIIHMTAPQLPKWDEVAKVMDQGFTGNAIRQKFQKLRKECKEKFGEAGESTPAKPKATKAGTPATAKGKRKARDEAETEVGVDDEDRVEKEIKAEEGGEST